MKSNVVQLHNVTPEEFKNEILIGVKKELSIFQDSLINTRTTEYITRKEVADMLGVSLTTIHFWCKREILKPMRIGNRVRFSRKHIEEILESSTSNK